jgi:ATP-dependent Clp protease protease subunit
VPEHPDPDDPRFPDDPTIPDHPPSPQRVPIPVITEDTPRGERTFDLFSRLLSERIILIGTPIDDHVANSVTAQMIFLESEDPDRDIWLYINSPGGSITSLLGIYDTMQFVRPDVATLVLGQAASAASLLLATGTRGKRFALPHSRVVIHQPQGAAEGQAIDIDIHAREVIRLRALLDDILAKHTGQPIERVRKDTDRDFIMAAEEARDYGIVDAIIESRDGSGMRERHLAGP